MQPQKLTNLQLELLKVFNYELNEQQLTDIRDLLAKYFAEQATQEMDKNWEQQGRDENTTIEMTISKLPGFTSKAAKLWAAIPSDDKSLLLDNVYCSRCRDAVKIINFKGSVQGGDLVLNGECNVCGNAVARVIES